MAKMLWKPSQERINASRMLEFMRFVNARRGTAFDTYESLYSWSVERIADFWTDLFYFLGIMHSGTLISAVDDPSKMPGAKFFEGIELNFARNLLCCEPEMTAEQRPRCAPPRTPRSGIGETFYAPGGETAIIFRGEDRVRIEWSRDDLLAEVSGIASALRELGLQPGDRVGAFTANVPQTVAAMLASTSLGATWTSTSPDFGLKGVLDRFSQVRPRVLFATDGYFYKGKKFDSMPRIREIVRELPSVEKVVLIPYVGGADLTDIPRSVSYDEFRNSASPRALEFTEFPFSWPLYIMYSSGTTGLPKCMVQSAGGVLLNQMKEHVLHTDVRRGDRVFYYTTCGWMMWNWLVAALSTGAAIVLYDGNAFYPSASSLWRMAQDEKITVFGTSAAYIAALEAAGEHPGRDFDLSTVRAILSTGSPLSPASFEYVYSKVKNDVQLASISGGSDFNGCFALGNPIGPVYSGELQVRGLGMKVEAFDEKGQPVINQKGELVCTAAFPSMPIYFWNDPDGSKYHAAYFDVYPGVWRHGDFIEINDRGGVIVYGRSDATLNPGGVRIGTAEIYRLIEGFREIEDSVVVGQSWRDDVRVILFVKMAPGNELTEDLRQRLRQAIREGATPRHVPAKIIAVKDIPYTLNMKKVELAVKNVIEGKAVTNRDALKNPEALDYFVDLPELKD